MEVILVKNVTGLGAVGDIVKVKSGYAQNYLVPKGYVVRKTAKAMEILESQKEEIAKQKEEYSQKNEQLIADLKAKGTLSVKVRVGGGDKLFGTVNSSHIVLAVASEFGIELDKKQVVVKETVRTIGQYVASVRLSREHNYDMPFNVVPDTIDA